MSSQVALGQSSVVISRLGLGGFELGPEEGEEPDIRRGLAVCEAALEAGVTWLDTAEAYHDTRNESLIGDVLRGSGADLLVATKVAPAPDGSGLRPDEIRSACEASLRRLGRERIDIYFLHWPDETDVPLDETWGAMAALADESLVRAIGLSNYPLRDIERCHAQRRVDVVQDGLSLVDHLDNRELFSSADRLGIAGVVYEPLGSGTLTGRSIDEVRRRWEPYAEWAFYKRLLAGTNGARSATVVEGVRAVADRVGASVPQVAIAWVLHQAGVTAALAGSRNPDHVRTNAAAAELDLAAVVEEFEALIPLGPTFVPTAG